MSCERVRRVVKQPKRFEYTTVKSQNTRWSIKDKRLILVALKKYSDEDVVKIHNEFLPHRTLDEISSFLQKMLRKAQYTNPVIRHNKMPIELWHNMVQELTANSHDLSHLLPKVFMKLGQEEPHDMKPNEFCVDWGLVYQYIAQLLEGGHSLPPLGQVEAGIVLDMLECLSGHLRQLNVAAQQSLLHTKYRLLATLVEPQNRQELQRLGKAALEQDLQQLQTLSADNSNNNADNNATTTTTTTITPNAATTTTTNTTTTHATTTTPTTPTPNTTTTTTTTTVGVSPGIETMKKPLFTINPLNIPIKYLNPTHIV